jgi:CAAX protease family protein
LLGGFVEEIGWRGYLQPRLASLGLTRSAFATGFAHGVWHLPLILLTPFYHSGGSILLIVPLFLVTLTLGGGLYGWLRVASGSVWPAALAHAVFNDVWERLDQATTYSSDWAQELLAGESGIAVIAVLVVINLVLWRKPPVRSDSR